MMGLQLMVKEQQMHLHLAHADNLYLGKIYYIFVVLQYFYINERNLQPRD